MQVWARAGSSGRVRVFQMLTGANTPVPVCLTNDPSLSEPVSRTRCPASAFFCPEADLEGGKQTQAMETP